MKYKVIFHMEEDDTKKEYEIEADTVREVFETVNRLPEANTSKEHEISVERICSGTIC